MKRNLVKYILLGCLFLSACSKPPSPTPIPPLFTPTPSEAAVFSPDSIRASGVIVPAQKANLSFAQNGQVESILVKEGDAVQAGAVIARLASVATLQAAVASAELEVVSAQQALDDLIANAPLAKANAYAAVANAFAEVREAQYQLYYFLSTSGSTNLDAIQYMELTQQELEQARQAFDTVKLKSETDPARRALKERLDTAESNNMAALRRLELESRLMGALARLEKAKQDYTRLSAGPDPKEMALAQARLKNAQAQLEMAKANLSQAELKAPFAGTITSLEISPAETVLAGSVVAVIGNLQEFRVETSDLSERDIGSVQIGQKAIVYVEALKKEISGKVVEIAPQANTLGGDVVYTVVIALDEQIPALRWGMSAEVEIITEALP
ncbi:MAG: HlyD family secretion protein [Chloroflexota bacterium]